MRGSRVSFEEREVVSQWRKVRRSGNSPGV